MAKPQKKKTTAFTAQNVEDITTKPAPIKALWEMLSKMDPSGDLFVADTGIIAVAGSAVKDSPSRDITKLKFSPVEKGWIEKFAILDSPEPDNEELATGVLFTMYQFAELAFSMGAQWEAARVNSAIVKAADADDDDDEVDDESTDEVHVDEDMDSVVDDDDDIDGDDDDDDA